MIAEEARERSKAADTRMAGVYQVIARVASTGDRSVAMKLNDREHAILTLNGYAIAPAEKEGEFEVSW